MPIPAHPPGADEYAPFYAGYVASVAGEHLPALLERQPSELRAACASLSEEAALHRYAAGKWSIKEVLGHLADSERIFAYRALRIGRGDPTPLPPFDENAYVAAADSDDRPLPTLLADLEAVRTATLALLRSLPPSAWERRGVAGESEVSVLALAHIIGGHVQHHVRILRDRYGVPLPPG